jgi:hypothetical protein
MSAKTMTQAEARKAASAILPWLEELCAIEARDKAWKERPVNNATQAAHDRRRLVTFVNEQLVPFVGFIKAEMASKEPR